MNPVLRLLPPPLLQLQPCDHSFVPRAASHKAVPQQPLRITGVHDVEGAVGASAAPQQPV